MKDYKERSNFIQELSFGNASLPCKNPLKKDATKTELCNGKSCIKKLYT